MSKIAKRVLKVVLVAVIAVLIVLVGYVAYLQLNYYRIADNDTIEIENQQSDTIQANTEYTAVTYNIGFGAYLPEYSFFLDEGTFKDGTQVTGEHSWALSKEAEEYATNGVISTLNEVNPNFIFLQEVDTDSTRSYGVNQKQLIQNANLNKSTAYAVNMHTAFLPYPVLEPHGFVNSGIAFMSDFAIDNAVRRSYPISQEFIAKFFDLDRCFEVVRLTVENGKEVVFINSHMSAYDEGGVFRAKQLELICNVMAEEAAKGNYVIVGGDWNHALCGSEEMYPSAQIVPEWVSFLSNDDLPEGFSIVRASNLKEVATCRNSDIPYEKGVSYETTVDGFIVSSNVVATAENIDLGYIYSDHNPVKLKFKLLG